jgi:sterol desaturase/sphingolipid hydroxylase (fatty acid hydroxylase superfamily)/rhodanese-related sulfurtransferase
MLQVLWDTRNYFFWLMLVSLACCVLERLWPWRQKQRALRPQIGQDLFWLVFNGHYAGIALAFVGGWALSRAGLLLDHWPLSSPESLQLLKSLPLWLQFIFFLVFKDLLEWLVHNLLHRVSWLWQFHKLHHSIEALDWIGNMRFHWMEIVVYKSLTYLPLVILGIDGRVILWVAIFGTVIGHLNHSNLNISWGPLRYVLNSPRMHVWHHDLVLHGRHGQNFAIIFSLWDWLFRTAFMPSTAAQPEQLGFDDIDTFPKSLWRRLLFPFWIVVMCQVPLATTAEAQAALTLVEQTIELAHPVANVSAEKLAKDLQEEADSSLTLLFDVRKLEEYEVSHLKRSIRVDPEMTADAFVDSFGASLTGKKVVLYCSVGYRSSVFLERVQAVASDADVHSLSNLRGGIFRWYNSGHAVVDSGGLADRVHPYDRKWEKLLNSRPKQGPKPVKSESPE